MAGILALIKLICASLLRLLQITVFTSLNPFNTRTRVLHTFRVLLKNFLFAGGLDYLYWNLAHTSLSLQGAKYLAMHGLGNGECLIPDCYRTASRISGIGIH
jgi:hypothetical protein